MKKRILIALATMVVASVTTAVLAGSLALLHHIAQYSFVPPEMFGWLGLFIIIALMAMLISSLSSVFAGIAILNTHTTIRKAVMFGLCLGMVNATILELFTVVYHERYFTGIALLTAVSAGASVIFVMMNKTLHNHGLESTGAPPAAGTPETHP